MGQTIGEASKGLETGLQNEDLEENVLGRKEKIVNLKS